MVGVGAGLEEAGDAGHVVAGGDEGRFCLFVPDLSQTDRCHESVADTFASWNLRGIASFSEEVLGWFAGASIADRPIRFAVNLAQIAEVADAGSVLVKR